MSPINKRNYDEHLQKQYSPSQWSPRLAPNKIVEAHGEYLKNESERALKELTHYVCKLGDHEEQCVHFFYKDENSFRVDFGPNKMSFNGRNVFVYLHGGYWQWGSVKMSSFMARNFVQQDVIVASIGYRIAPEVRMHELVEDVERAVATILQFANESKVYICGHSAGGHLAALMLHTDFEKKYNVSSSAIRGIIPVSGVFDLSPLTQTDVNDNLEMSQDDAQSLSPFLKLKSTIQSSHKQNIKILLAYGQFDSPAFKEQSETYLRHLKNVLDFNDSRCLQIENVDHFNVIENLSDDQFQLTREIYDLMGIDTK